MAIIVYERHLTCAVLKVTFQCLGYWQILLFYKYRYTRNSKKKVKSISLAFQTKELNV